MSFISNVGYQPTSGGYANKHRGKIRTNRNAKNYVRDSSGRFASGWGVAWQGLEEISTNLDKLEAETMDRLHRNVEQLKDEMVAYMKANAPWQDDPSNDTNARESLQGAVIWEDETHFTIMLGHGENIFYGIWLEVRHGGKYAIVNPTVRHFAPLIGGKLAGGT